MSCSAILVSEIWGLFVRDKVLGEYFESRKKPRNTGLSDGQQSSAAFPAAPTAPPPHTSTRKPLLSNEFWLQVVGCGCGGWVQGGSSLLCPGPLLRGHCAHVPPCPPLATAGLTFSRGRKMTGSERARPGLRKMGWGTTVKKNLVLGGLWEGAKEYTLWDQKTRRGRKIMGDPGKLSSWWDCGRGNTGVISQ